MEFKYIEILLCSTLASGLHIPDGFQSVACNIIIDFDGIDLNDTRFYLFTREHQQNSVILNMSSPENVPSKAKTKIIIHGYNSNYTQNNLPAVKDAYLKRYDCNVIMMDWSAVADGFYPTVVCRLQEIAKILTNFLCKLVSNNAISMESVHLVGHSLGAQMSGQAGHHTKMRCNNKIGRITGLDPAAPLFQGAIESLRLDKNDADFVDVIHTSEFLVGYGGNIGSVDFHVNCGTFQNSCPGINETRPISSFIDQLRCNHQDSIEYFKESINSDQFIAKSCIKCPVPCEPDKINPEYIVMGEDCPRNSSKSSFFIPTNSKAPYAQGWRAYRRKAKNKPTT